MSLLSPSSPLPPDSKHKDGAVSPSSSSKRAPDGSSPTLVAQAGASLASSSTAAAKTETEEILDSILPPREWEEDGQLWRQSVSSTPATRLDVINLQEQLDAKLGQRQARETGICQVRRELYAQCFDELIRQCTINCTERGLLLLRWETETRSVTVINI